MYFCFFLFFVNISLFKKFFFIILIFILTFFIANQSPNLKAKYNFIDIFGINQKIYNITDKNFINSVIKENRHFIHYKIATNIFKQHFLFGKGFKTYKIESYNKKYFDDDLEFSIGLGSTHPHQLHFEILSELGIIGYILIISNFIFLIFKQTSLKKNF